MVESYDKPCHDTIGSPLKASDLIRVFAKERVTLYSLPESMYCDNAGRGVRAALFQVADVSNQRSVVQDEDAVARQGWITCNVLRGDRAMRSWAFEYELDLPPNSPIFSGTKSRFEVANIGCWLYPHGDRDAVQARTRTMIRAFRQLDTLRQQRNRSAG